MNRQTKNRNWKAGERTPEMISHPQVQAIKQKHSTNSLVHLHSPIATKPRIRNYEVTYSQVALISRHVKPNQPSTIKDVAWLSYIYNTHTQASHPWSPPLIKRITLETKKRKKNKAPPSPTPNRRKEFLSCPHQYLQIAKIRVPSPSFICLSLWNEWMYESYVYVYCEPR